MPQEIAKETSEGFSITNIRKGKGEKSCYTYCELRDPNGKLICSATLDYVLARLYEILRESE